MNILNYMQRLGKALMLPIATLPVAAMLLRLGQPDLLNIAFMAEAGNAIFSHLPLLFAMGIACGLAKDDAGSAVLAGAVGYFVLTAAAKTIDESIDMSFFGGIIAGIIAGHSYNKFHATEMPSYLAFFGGKRLVPIMTGLIALAVSVLAGYIWPSIQSGINSFALAVSESGPVGQFFYGVLNRGLIPVGLHHVVNSVFWFGLGEFTNAAGEIVNGDLPRFFAGDPTAGVFMAGFYPVMMFGLPAAAFAMYLTAHKENRAKVGGVLFSVALTAFLTGVTEPLEFMFVFLAPALYAVHAVLTGLSLVVTNSLGVLHGFGFSAGAFDLLLNWGLATNPVTLIMIGLAFAAIYFCAFYFGIKAFNLKTPGREDEEVVVETVEMEQSGRAERYIALLGGQENLKEVGACITRLRLTLKDSNNVDEAGLKALGAKGVVRLSSSSLQVILGPQAEIIAGEINQRLS
ncbi:N-acetylglucosamine-specific PTS transporter subunit IIBC [Endozoicomonas gorgoniicola]|uniref:N-acetylglucosamine-specific PTS transporter subunit IIBC n=1 Tax=Endozoicomonas gorgoniicola TaxID=1234144 RepID=A0ABT3N3B8_9GAMM|nr:N-acetylglucosamine-specific PTS transporter subunit IIBC [Endozoicomonas gorgoniicola]MCW7556137.1 N-acetylglucosamine-specific PTS transporter subunit IIBC [Endozoicomonas gorgoniicola]